MFRYFCSHVRHTLIPHQKDLFPGLGCHHSELRRGAGGWLMVDGSEIQKSGECIYTCSIYLLYLPGTYLSTFCICRRGIYIYTHTHIYIYIHKDVKECFSANLWKILHGNWIAVFLKFLVWEPSSSRLYQHTHICAISDGLQAGISGPIEQSCCAVCDI